MTTQEKIKKSPNTTDVSRSIGLPSLIVVENKKAPITDRIKTLKDNDFKEVKDYLEVMEGLEKDNGKVLYIEQADKLDSSMLEIIAEFGAGIISLADRKNNTGIKTVKFNPFETLFVVVMTRDQVEKSYPRLFEYIGTIESIG